MLNRMLLSAGVADTATVDDVFSQRYARLDASSYISEKTAIVDTYIPTGNSAGYDGFIMYGLPAGSTVRATASDSSGNVYVIGDTYSTTGPSQNFFLAKMNSSLEMVWQKVWYNVEQLLAVAVDNAGNIVTVGRRNTSNDGNFAVKKFDANGTVLFCKNMYYVSSQDMTPMIAFDSANNVYIALGVYDSYYKPLLIKLNSSLVKQWSYLVMVSESSYYQYASGLFCDSSDNVYISMAGSNPTLNIFKLNSSGTVLAKKYFAINTGVFSQNYFWNGKACIDASGNIYCVGEGVLTAGGYVAIYAKLDTSLNLSWFRYIPNEFNDIFWYSTAMPIGAAGAGGAYASWQPTSGTGTLFLKIKSDGTIENPIMLAGSNYLSGHDSSNVHMVGKLADYYSSPVMSRIPKDGSCTYGEKGIEFSSINVTPATETCYVYDTYLTQQTYTVTVTDFTTSPTSGTNGFSAFKADAQVGVSNKAIFMFSQYYGNPVYDTVRGATKKILLNTSAAQATPADGLKWFSGKNVGLGPNYAGVSGQSLADLNLFTLVQKPGFFDIVQYTGDGTSGKQIAHALGAAPGCIMIKRLDGANAWAVYHRGVNAGTNPQNYVLRMTNAAAATDSTIWNNTAPTSSVFTVGNSADVNANGGTYIAYLFGHDTSETGMIRCGHYIGGDGTSRQNVNLGWEAQSIIVKNATTASQNWAWTGDSLLYSEFGSTYYAQPNDTSYGTLYGTGVVPAYNGFDVAAGNQGIFNTNGAVHVYIAIRNNVPAATIPAEFFNTYYNSGYAAWNDKTVQNRRKVDWNWLYLEDGSGSITPTYNMWLLDRRIGNTSSGGLGVRSTQNSANQANAPENIMPFEGINFVNPNMWDGASGSGYRNHYFTRTKGLFDRVRYVGNGSTQTIPHQLGAVPEMIIFSTGGYSFAVYHKDIGANAYTNFASGAVPTSQTGFVGSLTDAAMGLNNVNVNNTLNTAHYAYMFASKAGFVKVGSYVGNGSTQNIDCGFNGPARFVLIKSISASAGDMYWYAFSQVLGLAYGNDYFVRLADGAYVQQDAMRPYGSGFTVNNSTYGNTSGKTYIYLAIA